MAVFVSKSAIGVKRFVVIVASIIGELVGKAQFVLVENAVRILLLFLFVPAILWISNMNRSTSDISK